MATTRILVPLDGSPLAESALPEAQTLARALGGDVVFLQVVPPEIIHEFGLTIPIAVPWEVLRDRALEYLNSIRARPEWKEIGTEAAIETGNPPEMILDFCQHHDIDRIVMATHGRTGLARWVIGSVADKVVRAADRTVVLVRAGKTGANADPL